MFFNVGAQVVEISGDSSNLVSAIQTGYENIVSIVALKFVNEGNEIDIKVFADCPDGSTTSPDGASCSNVTTDQTVLFDVDVMLNTCTEEFSSRSRIIPVNIPGYGQFYLQVQGLCT